MNASPAWPSASAGSVMISKTTGVIIAAVRVVCSSPSRSVMTQRNTQFIRDSGMTGVTSVAVFAPVQFVFVQVLPLLVLNCHW